MSTLPGTDRRRAGFIAIRKGISEEAMHGKAFALVLLVSTLGKYHGREKSGF